MSAKYVVVKHKLHGELMMIFPMAILHINFIKGKYDRSSIVSAGFVGIKQGRLSCFGESVSLGAASRGNIDSLLANRMLGLWGEV